MSTDNLASGFNTNPHHNEEAGQMQSNSPLSRGGSNDKTEVIKSLLSPVVRIEFDAVVKSFGGEGVVMSSLDQSGYSNFSSLRSRMVQAVSSFHTKKIAQDTESVPANELQINIDIADIQNTIKAHLIGGFVTHGANLKRLLSQLVGNDDSEEGRTESDITQPDASEASDAFWDRINKKNKR